MTIHRHTRRFILIVSLVILLILTTWFSWRLLRVPEASLTGLLPRGQIASIRVSDLRGLIDGAKSDRFLNEAVRSPLAQDFERSYTWRLWVYQKQQLEYALQSKIDERYLKEALGKHALIALYPDDQFFVTSIVSPLARLQILWDEWTDLFRKHYDITHTRRQGLWVATLDTPGGTFYYALIGRFGWLTSDVRLFDAALERYRNPPEQDPPERVTTYVDIGNLPADLPYAGLVRELPISAWRSQIRWEQDRWVSLHQFSLITPWGRGAYKIHQGEQETRPSLGTSIPREAVLAGFVRLSPDRLWQMLRPYVSVESPHPTISPQLQPGLSFSVQATDHLLPGVTLELPAHALTRLAQNLRELHGKVRLLEKPIKVSPPTTYAGVNLFRLSWSPALLIRIQGGYAISDRALLVGNDGDRLKLHLDAERGNVERLERLSDLQDSDGALWLRPAGLPPILKQCTRLMGLTSILNGPSLPWLLPLSDSGDAFQYLEEIRVSWKVEGQRLSLRIEITPTR